jgi:hypothetical protein
MGRKPYAYRELPVDIDIIVKGQIYNGSYRLEEGCVIVTLANGGTQWATLNGEPEGDLAKQILRELVDARIDYDKCRQADER